ncbi:MAG: IS1634 family transposase [Chitinophagaceae bacterium]
MFVRHKKNKTGTISVQVIDKSSGKYKVIHSAGSSADSAVIANLAEQAKNYIHKIKRQGEFDFFLGDDARYYQSVYENIEQVQLLGPELVLGKIFNEVGFNIITDELFRHLVIARLIYPVSKLKTLDYLQKYKGIVYGKDEVYRYLDKLHKEQIKQVQQISYQHTLKILDGVLSVVFYDVTTLYFEAEDEDDLRKTGFSKDGKHQQPQIVLGLLVSQQGYPLDYEIFEGNKFEGHTMLPVVEAFTKKYQTGKLIVVADAGLMSDKNIKQLTDNNYEFIIGGRIKNETHAIQQAILAFNLADGESTILTKTDEQRLIVSYAASRARRDEHNRRRGLAKLEKQLEKGKLTKKHINNKGYNKYLKLSGEIKIEIDYDKYKADAKWDGLKGYITNTTLSKEEVIDYYKQLWNIEKTFRISKTDLRIRPVYHYLRRRIEAHICIAFAACKVYKELERQLKNKKSNLSPENIIDILKTIYAITIILPQSKEKKLMLLDKTEVQKSVLKMFG